MSQERLMTEGPAPWVENPLSSVKGPNRCIHNETVHVWNLQSRDEAGGSLTANGLE